MADDPPSALPGQPLMVAVERASGGETLRLASVVFWNVQETGLRGRLSAMAQPVGSDPAPPPSRYTCDVGVIAVGERRVFRLHLGKAPMAGATANEATLPAELLARFPLAFFADEVAAIRPLSVVVEGDRLYIRALGRGVFDLAVRTPASRSDIALGAEAIADAVRTLLTWPTPEDAIATIVTGESGALDPTVARALADRDYADAFVDTCAQQAPDVRRALALAAHAGPRVLQNLIDRVVRAGAPNLRTIVVTAGFCALLVIGGAAAIVVLGSGLVSETQEARAGLAAITSSGKFALITFMSIFGFASIIAGIALIVRGWRYIERRDVYRRMLTQGAGPGGTLGGGSLGGDRDALLALAALRGPAMTASQWHDVEAAATSDTAFADRLCAGLLAVPAANRDIFLKGAPSSLRQFLVRALTARQGFALSLPAQALVAAWIACLAVGIGGAVIEASQAAMSATDWLLLLAGATALPALMLATAQITHWVRSRRLLRLL